MTFFPLHPPSGKRVLLAALAVCVLAGMATPSGAALTVSAAPVVEGNLPAVPGEAVFTLTLSPVAAVDTSYQYTTASDTARELEDYLPARGSITIPAGQSSATVSVPLVADSWQEGTESFSLIVWPEGTAPAPALTGLSLPPGDSAAWTGELAGLSEGNWFLGNLLGERNGNNWNGLRYFTPPGTVPPGAQLSYSLSGPWLAYSFSSLPSQEFPSGHYGSAFSDKAPVAPSPLVWNNHAGFPFPAPDEWTNVLTMSGDIAVIAEGYVVNFHQLSPAGPARFRGSLRLGRIFLPPNNDEGVVALALAGRRLAVATQTVVRIFEASTPDLGSWKEVAYLPGLTVPLSLEGDHLLATPSSGPDAGTPGIHARNQGGAGAWGRTTFLRVPGSSITASRYGTLMRGGMALMADRLGGSSTTPSNPGRIHRFLREATGSTWSYAGYFTAPVPQSTDYFGNILVQAGRDILTTAHLITGEPGLAGSFPGATVQIHDDDLPSVHLEAQPVDEPLNSSRAVPVTVKLSQRSAVGVTVTWATADETAMAGQDYLASSGSLVIPAGQDSAVFEISILPDTLVEPVESFRITLTSANGALWDAASVPVRIRDTNRPAVVNAPARTLYEDLPAAPAQVQLFPQTQPLTIGWKIGTIGYSSYDGSPDSGQFAQPGVDWPAASGQLTALSAQTLTFPWSVTSDGLSEKVKTGSVIMELPAGAIAASFSLRHHYQLPPGSSYKIEHSSSDGRTIAALEKGPARVLHLFQRSAAEPGGWARRLVPPPPGLTEWPEGALQLRQGRMVFFAHSGAAWFYAENAGGPGNWGLEATSSTLPAYAYYTGRSFFDGETLLVPTGSSFLLVNRGTGDWDDIQNLSVGTARVLQGCLENGQLAVSLDHSNPETAEIHFYTRRTNALTPWEAAGSPLILNSSAREFHLAGNLLVISDTMTPKSSTIYRRQADGTWQLEQIIPDRETRSIDRGLILTDFGLYTDAGPMAQRWIPADPSPLSGLLQNGILLQSYESSFDSSGFFLISEAGLSTRLVDEDSYRVTARADSNWLEWADKERVATVTLGTPGLPAPVDIVIPFKTIPGGTATPEVDYRSVQGTVTIPAGGSAAYLAVPLLPDALTEPAETVLLEFGTPTYGQVSGTGSSPILTSRITDFPLTAAAPSTARFVPEPASGSATYSIPFRMTRPSSAAFNARYRIIAGSATAADAVLTTSGILPMPPGSCLIPVPLTILADSLVEDVEQLQIIVDMGGLSVSTLVSIDDFPPAPHVPDSYSALQGLVLDFDPSRNVLTNDPSGATSVIAARPARYGTVTWQADGTFKYTPPPNFTGTDYFAYTAGGTSLFKLPENTVWKWLNPNTGQDPGVTIPGFQTSWMQPSFNDALWQNGTGLMGYGIMGSGNGVPLNTTLNAPASGSRYTAYFRTTFNVPVSPAAGVGIEFSCDDAVICYLNGSELGRFDKTAGSAFFTAPDTYRLLASTLLDAAEETQSRRVYFPTAQMLSGANTISISLHNNAATSSDLGLRVTQLTAGPIAPPVYVSIQVADSGQVPVLQTDSYTVPGTATPVDSHLIGGSAYDNDGLLSETGIPYDPVLEVEIGGSPLGPVTFQKETGHFTMAPPSGFFGATSFTYRVRDKDGWSLPAAITITIQPNRGFDVWRAAQFGGGSSNTASLPLADGDGDHLANLLEYTLNRSPVASESSAPLTLAETESGWVIDFGARTGYGEDAVLLLETTSALNAAPWIPLARLNDLYYNLAWLAKGVILTDRVHELGGHRQYRVTLPGMQNPTGFFRLRAQMEEHPLDP